jgi:hypothetical protein
MHGGVSIRTGAEVTRAWETLAEGALPPTMQSPRPAIALVAAPAWEMRTASSLVWVAAAPTSPL